MKMKKSSAMGIAILTIILASGCGSSKNTLQTSALEGEWNIITVNGKEAIADKEPDIRLCRVQPHHGVHPSG